MESFPPKRKPVSPKHAWWRLVGSPRSPSPEMLPLLQQRRKIAGTPKSLSTAATTDTHRRNCCAESAMVILVLAGACIAIAGAVWMIQFIEITFEVGLSIGLLIVAACCSVYGGTLMRLSHYRKLEIDAGLVQGEELKAWKQPRFLWWVGLTLFVCAQGFMPFVFALSPMSLLAPLMSCHLLINLVMAHFLLGEDVTKCDVLATLFSVCCLIGVIYFGPKETARMMFATDILSTMRVWGVVVICWMFTTTLVCLGLYLCRSSVQNWEKQKYFVMPWMTASLTAFSFALVKVFGDQLLHLRHMTHDEMVQSCYQLGIALLLIGVFAPGSAYFKIRSTEEFDARWFMPVNIAGTVVLQLLLGAAAFHEWEGLSVSRILLFLGFSFLCVFTVLLIDPRDSLREKIEQEKQDVKYEPDCEPQARGSKDII